MKSVLAFTNPFLGGKWIGGSTYIQTETPISDAMTQKQSLWERLWEKTKSLTQKAGSSAFYSALSKALKTIAYDTATWIGSGGEGQKPQKKYNRDDPSATEMTPTKKRLYKVLEDLAAGDKPTMIGMLKEYSKYTNKKGQVSYAESFSNLPDWRAEIALREAERVAQDFRNERADKNMQPGDQF